MIRIVGVKQCEDGARIPENAARCFTVWMAGGGVKAGFSYGTTDDFAYNVTQNPVHVHDFHATLLHLLRRGRR